MTEPTKFRIQAGALIFEVEGSEPFVKRQMREHQIQIEAILAEQAKLIQGEKIAPAATGKRRGRPPKRVVKVGGGRRPGRQPVIIRDSRLTLKPRALSRLKKYLSALAAGGNLGKDATVFAIANYLCQNVLKKDVFTAGDVSAVYRQVGKHIGIPAPDSVDVVQMLRNLAAVSIGKEWVKRQVDGTFALTAKGKAVGASGQIVRPRGRRPSKTAAVKRGKVGRPKGRPGRPPGPAKATGARRGRPKAVVPEPTE